MLAEQMVGKLVVMLAAKKAMTMAVHLVAYLAV